MHVVACRFDRVCLDALLDLGATTSLVVDEWEAANRPLRPELTDRLAAVHVVRSFDDMASMSELAVTLAAGPAVDRVLSLAEYGQLGAAYLATLLSRPTPSVPASVLVRDKRAMKRRAHDGGLPCARQAGVTSATVEQAVARVGLPAVLKPNSGMGTVDTWHVTTADDIVRHLPDSRTDMVLEEFVAGEEYHVDAVWRDGEPLVLGASRYLVPRLQITTPGRDNGSALLSPDAFPRLHAELAELSRRVCRVFGIRHGITHTEFFRTADGGWVFSEIATRPAGAAIPALFREIVGDLRTVWIRSEIDPAYQPVCRSPAGALVGWVNIAPDRPGIVTRAPTVDECRAFPYVIDVLPGHCEGARVRELHPSIWSWMLLVTASSWEEYAHRARELEGSLAVEVADADG